MKRGFLCIIILLVFFTNYDFANAIFSIPQNGALKMLIIM